MYGSGLPLRQISGLTAAEALQKKQRNVRRHIQWLVHHQCPLVDFTSITRAYMTTMYLLGSSQHRDSAGESDRQT